MLDAVPVRQRDDSSRVLSGVLGDSDCFGKRRLGGHGMEGQGALAVAQLREYATSSSTLPDIGDLGSWKGDDGADLLVSAGVILGVIDRAQ